MSGQLFLFEVLIDNIFFEEIVHDVPPKKKIVVSVKLGSITTLEIRSETLPTGGEGSNKRNIEFKSGKSYLCSISNEELLEIIEDQPLEVTVAVRGDVQPIGSCTAPWDNSFREVVLMSKDPNDLQAPAAITDNFCLMQGGTIKGNLNMVLKLSCFGKNIQTHFEILQESGKKQFIFKMHDVVTTFVCSRYGAGTSNDFIPINALFNGVNIRNEIYDKSASAPPKSISWTALMQERSSSAYHRSSLQSEFLFPEYLNIPTLVKESAITFDIQSLRGRADDEKFLDFITGKKLTDLDENSIRSMSFADTEGNERIIFYADDLGKLMDKESTADEIICPKKTKSCQCPKTPKLCKHVLDAIKLYEKSHPDLMIHGRRVNYDKLLKRRKESNEDKNDSTLRLKGGSDKETLPPYILKKGKGCYNKYCPMAGKLRNVGLSQLTEYTPKIEALKTNYFCQDFFCPAGTKRDIALQVTFSEDEIPFHFDCKNKYCPAARRFKELGLGPLAINRCQGTLYGPVDIPVKYGLSQTYGTFDTYGPYGIFSKTKTPYIEDSLAKHYTRYVLRLRGGGTTNGNKDKSEAMQVVTQFKSPIAECKDIMDQFDKILEEYKEVLNSTSRSSDLEQFMPPSTTPNCGHPRCTFISEPSLPPIHWDCPDPLPSGICQNPACPYLPKDLRRIHTILESREYARNCSLNMMCQQNFESASTFLIERNFHSKCPFYNPSKVVEMMQLHRLGKKTGFESCNNPECPIKTIMPVHGNAFSKGDITRPCSNPDCPLRKGDMVPCCSNPDCPFATKELVEECSNPDCPFKNESVTEACAYHGTTSEECQNPECPFKNDKPSDSSCVNPECPLKTGVLVDICDGTSDCKCENPDCPHQKKACSNPDCPFNYMAVAVCENPKCPYKSTPSSKKKGICGPPSYTICGDATCPFQGGDSEQKGEGLSEGNLNMKDGKGDRKKDTLKSNGKDGINAIIEGELEVKQGDRPSHYDFVPCNLTTCKFMGGKFECVDCSTLTQGKRRGPCPRICPGDVKCPLAIREAQISKRKTKESAMRALKKERCKFAYHFGDKYPGMHVGHKRCVITQPNVPSKMGWLWNLHTPCLSLRQRKGWKPGAIGKTILEAIQAHRRSLNMPPLEETKRKRKKKYGGDESETEIIRPKPTLQIKRKEGVYYITMNPLKDPRTLVTNENPYMEVTPMQFKIMKHKNDKNDYRSCVCNDQGIVVEPETSSSDSELDLEFTPPAGLIRPERFIKTKNVIHIDTQYRSEDFTPTLSERPKKVKEEGKEKNKDRKQERNSINKDSKKAKKQQR